MSHVFLSYARSDIERARQLAQALETHGFSVWWDRTIPPGKTFDQVIEEALEKADKVAVLWSASALASNWVRSEADVALERGVLVPVLIEDVLPPFSSRRIEAAELQRWTGDPSDPEFQNLVTALRGTGYIHVRPEDREPAPEPERPSAPPPPPPARRSGRGWKVALGAGGFLAVLGLALVVVVVMAIQRMPRGGSEAPPVPPSATITLRYTGDAHYCSLLVNFEVGPHRFAPQSSVYVLSDLTEGPTPYSIGGTITCPNGLVCAAHGAGTLNVRDGALYDLVWQTSTFGQCQATLIEASLY